MENDNSKRLFLIGLVITTIFAFTFPFLLVIILKNINFESYIFDSKDWFAFAASYFGALGTIILGWIAIWQSYKYNKESDKVINASILLQKDIKSLVESNKEVNGALLRLHQSMFEPRLADVDLKYDCGNWVAFNYIDNIKNDNAFAFSNWNDYDLQNFDEHEDEYRYIAVELFNDGDKYIVSYKIDCLDVDELNEFDCWYANITDIAPHSRFWMTVAVADEKYSIIENRLKTGKEVVIRSTFENSLGDKYISYCRIGYENSDEHNGAYIKGIDIKKQCGSNSHIEK